MCVPPRHGYRTLVRPMTPACLIYGYNVFNYIYKFEVQMTSNYPASVTRGGVMEREGPTRHLQPNLIVPSRDKVHFAV